MGNPLDLLLPGPDDLPRATFRLGTVVTNLPVRVRLDGDATDTPQTPITLEELSLGDRVMVMIYNRRMTVLGKIANYDLGTANLDDIQSTGTYFQRANANATPARNYPVASAGKLDVGAIYGGPSGYFVYQDYTLYSQLGATVGDALATYRRGLYNGSWAAWRRVDAGEDTGWVGIATATGYGAVSSYPLLARRKNGIVFLKGMLSRTDSFAAATQYTACAVVPPGFRPETTLFYVGAAHTNQVPSNIYLMPDGSINVRTGTTAVSWVGIVNSYIADPTR